MSTRFSKERLLKTVDEQISVTARLWDFDRDDGFNQLMPAIPVEGGEDLIDRAISYGRMRALEDLAEQVREGRL